MTRLILASGSPRRRALLGLLVEHFDVVVPHVDETFPPGPVEAAMETVALRKADAVTADADDVVLAADTTVVLGDRVLGKPTDAADALRSLQYLNGVDHHVVTAVALRGPTGAETFHATTTVRLDLPRDALESYVGAGSGQGKAGGYGLQEPAIAAHATITGSWSNVVGLPLEAVRAALTRHGVACHDAPDETVLARQNPF